MSSFKNIAVPPRTTTKKRGGAETPNPTGLAYLPATSVSVRPRAGLARTHRFAIGQRLSMAAGGRDIARGGSACVVVALLPHEGGPLRYRVRSDSESYERIVDETDLSPLVSGLE